MVQPLKVVPVTVSAPAELDLLEKLADYSQDISNSNVFLVPANKARTAMFIVNASDTDMNITFGRDAVIGQGIHLNAGGGSFEINKQNLIRSSMSAIAAAAGTKRLTILELESRYAY